MSDTSTAGLRAWLISDTPESRRQARLGQLYRQWLAFKRNPMAVAGLAILADDLSRSFQLTGQALVCADALIERVRYFSSESCLVAGEPDGEITITY